MRIGVECGGTFTDIVVLDDDGRLQATDKVFSTPSNPADAVREGLSRLDPELVGRAHLLHGSTVATNALIERKGARVGLIVTAGFRDLVFLRRQDRARMYDLRLVAPSPLVQRRDIVEVPERVGADGSIIQPLDLDAAERAIEQLLEQGVDAVAVALLHSYAEPAHEEAILTVARARHPELTVALSSRAAREFREYERTTTTVADAFLRPRVSRYLTDLAGHADELGVESLAVMQSHGGIVPAGVAAEAPLGMLRSGPAAGVAGAIAVAEQIGITRVVTMDMGGTSTDVAVVNDGRAEQAVEMMADGLPLRVPMVDIIAVGAGGGSLVGIDSGGLLTVGPRSAGADPGPVCYGRGGTQPTVTDANLVRGLIRPETFLGGRHRLDVEAARTALGRLATQLDRSVEELAEDVYRLAGVHMAGAIRIATTERGFDAADYTLVAYGGAGALHAACVADELGMRRVLVPPHAGLASAYGLLTAGFRRELACTLLGDHDLNDLREPMDRLIAQAREGLAAHGIDDADATYSFAVDMRYRGQGFEVSVDVLDDVTRVAELSNRFHQVHERRYGHSEPSRATQIVTLRLTVTKPRPHTALPKVDHDDCATPVEHTILEGGRASTATFVGRSGLSVGSLLPGPAVVEDATSTVFIPTGWSARVDEATNLLLERTER